MFSRGVLADRQKGFTLIELLVVIAIIGLLAAVVLASLNAARERSRDARRFSDMKQMQLALELYYNEKGDYPAGFHHSISGTSNNTWNTTLKTALAPYLPDMPQDPVGGTCVPYTDAKCHTYSYLKDPGGKCYMLVFLPEQDYEDLEERDGIIGSDGSHTEMVQNSRSLVWGVNCPQ